MSQCSFYNKKYGYKAYINKIGTEFSAHGE